jgi:hypothetical protein
MTDPTAIHQAMAAWNAMTDQQRGANTACAAAAMRHFGHRIPEALPTGADTALLPAATRGRSLPGGDGRRGFLFDCPELM